MRAAAAALLAALALTLSATPAALAQGGSPLSSGGSGATGGSNAAGHALTGALNLGMREAGVYSGSEVVDLTTGATLYSRNANVPRLPASVEKLYTTTTALERFGPEARLTTSLLGTGRQSGSSYVGTLYLRGDGDPTFGSAAFDHRAYGTGATVQQLVAGLIRRGIRAFRGSIVADESRFDSDRGTPATANQPSIDVEGALSALSFNRDWADPTGAVYFAHPALEAGLQLAATLRADGVRLPAHVRIAAGRTPSDAVALADAPSPTNATLVKLTNAPSDNFFAETLLKDIGARFGTGGSTAAGVSIVRAEMASRFSIHPLMNDGSGLSRSDRTTPAQVVSLLGQMHGDPAFTDSLAVAGETGTLVDENRHTYAQGRCTGKTGTLHDVSNVVGYCRAENGDTLAYAFMMNGIYPDYAHPIQDRMQVAVARYDG